jgi:hypothetical protein
MIERAARREQLFHPDDGLSTQLRGLKGPLGEGRRWPLTLVTEPAPSCGGWIPEPAAYTEEDCNEIAGSHVEMACQPMPIA